MIAHISAARALIVLTAIATSGCGDDTASDNIRPDAANAMPFDASAVDATALDANTSNPPDANAPSSDAENHDDGIIDVVVFSKTEGFRHGSIASGIALIDTLGQAQGWRVSATEDSETLVASLDQTDVVVFCNTTGDVLSNAQQGLFEAFIRAGGGFVGIHAAADTEYEWPFYGQLVGAWFDSHPAQQDATVDIEASNHPVTSELPSQFSIREEWYNFQTNPRDTVTVLATVNESSYNGGDMGSDHPIMWAHEIGAGRAFYTGLGHRDQTYEDENFVGTIRSAIEWAAE